LKANLQLLRFFRGAGSHFRRSPDAAQKESAVMSKFALTTLFVVSLAAPAFAASEKPTENPAKGKGWHCRKLAKEKYEIKDGRMLNKAVGAAIQRCREHGPSAL